MGKKTRIFFATDLHGSSRCFRRFVNGARVHGAQVAVLGGDVAGKALQTIVRGPDDRWHVDFIGTSTGTLLGALVSLERGRVTAHQLVRG